MSAWVSVFFCSQLLTIDSRVAPIITPGRTGAGPKQLSEANPTVFEGDPSFNPKGSFTFNGGKILTHEINLESLKGYSETTIASTRCGNLIFVAFNSAQGFCKNNTIDHPTCPGPSDEFNNGNCHYTVSTDGGRTWTYMYAPPFLGTEIYTGGDPWFSIGGKDDKSTEELLYFSSLAVDRGLFPTFDNIGLSVHVARIIYENDDPRKKAINYEWVRSSLIPHVGINDFMDKEAIAADPYDADSAYVSLTLFDSALSFDIQVYATHNAGVTWEGPVVLRTDWNRTRIWNQMSYIVVNAQGEVYITWWEFLGTDEDYATTMHYPFLRSTDGGRTFEEIGNINPPSIKFNHLYQPPIAYNRNTKHSQPTMAVFTNKKRKKYLNRIIVSYEYGLTDEFSLPLTGEINDTSMVLNSVNIGISYSDNKGQTWHFVDPFKEDIPQKLVKRIFPSVSASSDGESVNVAYLEIHETKKPNDPVCREVWGTRTSLYHTIVDTYYIHSSDGGQSWSSPIKLNEESVDWCTTFSNIAPNYGDYMLSISDRKGNIHLAGVTNGFTEAPSSFPTFTAPDTIYYTSKCYIGSSCTETEDCCPGDIGESESHVTCSCYVKWNMAGKFDENNQFCCVKNMGKCEHDDECCGGKSRCIHDRCHNTGQWRNSANVGNSKRRLFNDKFIQIDIHMSWTVIAVGICSVCGIGMCVALYCLMWFKV